MDLSSSENIGVGDFIGKWKLIKKIAKSGFNDIYLGTFQATNAVIKIPKTEEFWDKIDNEIQCLTYLENKFTYFPQILDHYTSNDQVPWLALEVIEGENLKQFIENRGSLDEKQWFRLAEDLFEALSILDSKGITHEDIKPTNIFYNTGELKIIDFGLARIPNWVNNKLNDDSSVIDSWAGTFEYSSPEHFSGEHVPAMDVFSAASTLVFAGTNKSPFHASSSSEWMNAIGRDAPNLQDLTDAQIKFLNPLFVKNKSERQTSLECVDFLSKFNKHEISSKSSLFKSWPEIKNLTGTSFENEQIYQKLFKNRFQIKILSFGKNGLKFIANTFLIMLFYLVYIEPTNNLIGNIAPQSLFEKQKSNQVAKVISCIYDSYQANNDQISLESPESLQLELPAIADIKLKCQEITESGEALGYLGLANLSSDPLEKEQYLIQGAKLDETDGFDQLVSFYSEIAFLNFEIMGKPTLTKCTIQNDPFCLRVMGVMHYKIGVDALINQQIDNYQIPLVEMTNLDIEKGLNYLRQAAKLGDSSSAADLSTILRSRSQPIEYLDLIEQKANEGNLLATRWMYGDAVSRGDLPSQEMWTRKLEQLDDSTLTVLQISIEFGNDNYDKAYELAKNCLMDLEPMCYSIYGTILTGKVDEPKSEVEKYYLLAALMGDSIAINSFAELKLDQNQFKESEKWYWKGITKSDSDSHVGLGDLYVSQNDTFRACLNFKKAAVMINQRISTNQYDNYLKGNFDNGTAGTAELLSEAENLEITKFRNVSDKINASCTF